MGQWVYMRSTESGVHVYDTVVGQQVRRWSSTCIYT